MITNKNEAKTMAKHISYEWFIFNSTTCDSNKKKKWITKHANLNVKIIVSAKMIIAGIVAHVFVRIASI